MSLGRWASAVRALGAATVTPGVNGARAAAGCAVAPSFGGVGVRGLAGEAAVANTTTPRRPVVRHATTGGARFVMNNTRRPAREGPVTALMKARSFGAAEAVLSAEGLNSRQVRACPTAPNPPRALGQRQNEPCRNEMNHPGALRASESEQATERGGGHAYA